MSTADRLRIGDQEREAAAAALGEHFSTGRLTRDELDERSRLALEARTLADLRPLFTDLPLPHGPVVPASASWDRASGAGVARSRGRRFPWAPFVVALVVLAVLTDLPWILLALTGWVAWMLFSRRRRAERRARRDAWLSSWNANWQDAWNGSWSRSWNGGWNGGCGHGGSHTQESRGTWSRGS